MMEEIKNSKDVLNQKFGLVIMKVINRKTRKFRTHVELKNEGIPTSELVLVLEEIAKKMKVRAVKPFTQKLASFFDPRDEK